MAASAVCKHHALTNFFGKPDHLCAQGSQCNRRHLTGSGCVAYIFDKLPNISEWFALGHTQSIHGRSVTDTNAKAEAASGEFVDG